MPEEPQIKESPTEQTEDSGGSTGEDKVMPPADNSTSYPNRPPTVTSEAWDTTKFLNSLEVLSEGTRQLYEMRIEEKRLKEDLCRIFVEIINFTDVSIPISPDVLQGPDFQVEDARIGCEGVINVTLTNGEEKFKRLSDLDNRSVLKLIYDIVPKFRSAIESELKVLGDDINLMDKAVAEFKKAQPALRKDENESGAVDIVRETMNV
ncbi:MAG: hypothetical protein ACE5KU_04645 [Nitrososphaerales archaeon]